MGKTDIKSEVIKFTKEQLCSSVKYSKYKDILSSQLKDDASYTEEQVKKLIDDFLKGKVK